MGSVSLAGSAIAFAKLQELMTGRPITYPAQQPINAVIGLAIVVLLVVTVVTASTTVLVIVLVLSLVLGAIFVLPIGGADTPVLISLLNAFTGLAVAASGFTLNCTLAHRGRHAGGRLGHAAHPDDEPGHGPVAAEHPLQRLRLGGHRHRARAPMPKDGRCGPGPPEDIGVLLAYARKVAIVPGYGLAVAQAQHTARELADALAARGVEVYYAIHPVAGRMPGHMNVLLAEANVPYDQLEEMDDANQDMATTDVALVVGANDTVNPAAKNTPGSPIFGMPIINADQATNIVFLKRSMRPGFAGIDNELLYDPKTTMLFGDAKDSLSKLVAAVKVA